MTSGPAYSTLTSLQRTRYLFVCINRRAEENPKGCCAAKDSEEVYRALKGEVAARGLAKLEARVCTSSCLDQCATGVTVLVEPDHFFYGRVTVADVPEIVDGLVKGQPVKTARGYRGPTRSIGKSLLRMPKQSPWKLLAQFSLSRERDVANIIA